MLSRYVLGALFLALCIAIVSSQEESSCNLPFWHAKKQDNWPLAGVVEKAQPKFKMRVRGLEKADATFTPAKRYHVVLYVNRHKLEGSPRIHGFYIILKQNTTGCDVGTFTVGSGRKTTNATVAPACSAIFLDGSISFTRTRGMKWKAPACGCVTLAASIKTSENKIVEDDIESEEIEDKYKVLVKEVCAKD